MLILLDNNDAFLFKNCIIGQIIIKLFVDLYLFIFPNSFITKAQFN